MLALLLASLVTLGYVAGEVDQGGYIVINEQQYEMWPSAAEHRSCWDTRAGDVLLTVEADSDHLIFLNPRTQHVCEVLDPGRVEH